MSRDARRVTSLVSRASLERSDHPAGDPPAVEVALLGPHDLAVDETAVHRCGVHGHPPLERLEPAERLLVEPGGSLGPGGTAAHRQVAGRTLELAERPAMGWLERTRHERVTRQVVDRRVTGLEHPYRVGRVHDRGATELDHNAVVGRLHARWPRVVPDRLLARPGWWRFDWRAWHSGDPTRRRTPAVDPVADDADRVGRRTPGPDEPAAVRCPRTCLVGAQVPDRRGGAGASSRRMSRRQGGGPAARVRRGRCRRRAGDGIATEAGIVDLGRSERSRR